MKESALERRVVAYCKGRGMLCYKFTSPSHRGVPDRLILYRGRALFLELKAPGKTPDPLQEREAELIRTVGGFACVWSDNFRDAVNQIDALL